MFGLFLGCVDGCLVAASRALGLLIDLSLNRRLIDVDRCLPTFNIFCPENIPTTLSVDLRLQNIPQTFDGVVKMMSVVVDILPISKRESQSRYFDHF